MRTWSFKRAGKRNNKQIEEASAPDGTVKVYFLDGSHKLFDSAAKSVGDLLTEVKTRLSVAESNAFALYQAPPLTHALAHLLPAPSHAPAPSPHRPPHRPMARPRTPSPRGDPPPAAHQVQRGTHYLLHEDALVSEIRSSVDSRAKSMGMKERRPKLLFKKCLFTKQDERLISEKAFIHLFFIQAAALPHTRPHTPHHAPHHARPHAPHHAPHDAPHHAHRTHAPAHTPPSPPSPHSPHSP